jgi:NitT/TauT family transport system substrate-binding protein
MKKALCMILALALLVSLCACGKKEEESEPETQAAPDVTVRVMALNGPTGFGMAGLMHNSANGSAKQTYDFSVETDASNITAALISGSVDIAALPTNAAAVVYNKTGGAVQALALNTRGVLHLVSDGNMKIVDFTSLTGETIYAPAQNPSFIVEALCRAYGLTPGEDVFIDNTFAQPADLRTALASGQIHVAVLPEPMVTTALSENENLRVEMDLTEQWDQVQPQGSLVQGCVAVRREFAEQHPEQVKTFLEEYKASIALCTDDAATAAGYIAEAGILPKAELAQAAIPNCNLCFVTGADMKTQLSAYLEIIGQVNAQSIGGQMPGDDFYYLP